MSKVRLIMLGGGAVTIAVLGVVAWRVWRRPSSPPPPPPSTAEEVYAAVTESDPAQLPEEQRDKWLVRAGSAFDRLPPHEFEKLVLKAKDDPAWHERMASLQPEQRRKMMDLVSEQQRMEMFLGVVETLKKMDAGTRNVMLQVGWQRMRAQGQGRGPHANITKDQIINHLTGTTPTQRAKFVRGMRQLRQMAEEAGIGH
jgi:hypothetical protein